MTGRTSFVMLSLVVACGAVPSEHAAAATLATAAELTRLQDPSGRDILTRALAAHRARMEGIDNYTVIQSVAGMTSTVYFERETVDGHPQFRSHMVEVGGHTVPTGEGEWEDVYASFEMFADRVALRGTEAVDGHRTYALVMDDVSDLPGMRAGSPGMEDVRITSAILYLDAETYILRRMEMEGVADVDGRTQPVSVTTRLEDYREVQGMLHPYRTVMAMEGLDGAISEAERDEARRSLEQLQAQMREMPAAQREMMQSMLGSQLEQLEAMLGGSAEFLIEVQEIRVNQGPPAGR